MLVEPSPGYLLETIRVVILPTKLPCWDKIETPVTGSMK